MTLFSRRHFIRDAALGGGAAMVPGWARAVSAGITAPLPSLSGEEIALRVESLHGMIDGRPAHRIGINGGSPAPLLRLREGQRVRIAVTNALDEETSIHWHGLLLPFQMDGVPGISFPGIRRARPSPTTFR